MQAEHTVDCKPLAYVPATQDRHVVGNVPLEYTPAPHDRQTEDVVTPEPVEYLPRLQWIQPDISPVPVEYNPAGQYKQRVNPGE